MVNRYLVVPLVVWAAAQFLKFIIAAFRGNVDFRYLYGSGGMPSVHAAVVTSLATTSLIVDGANSAIFGLTAIFAAIVMYDSFGVRRSAGEQAVAINLILDSMEKDRLDHPRIRLREILGHKPLEVSVGAALGLILGALLNADMLGPLVTLITTPVGRAMAYLVAAVSILLLIWGALFRWVFFARYTKNIAAVRHVTRTVAWWSWGMAILGLILSFLQYERVSVGPWLIWPIVYLIILSIVKITLFIKYRRTISAAVADYRETQDKAKWLEGPNKKRRAKKAARARRRA